MRALSFLALVFSAACAAQSSTPTDAGDPIDASAEAAAAPDAADGGARGVFCDQTSHSCKSSTDCCSGECVYDALSQASYCVAATLVCHGNGTGCINDDECCSGECSNGVCVEGCSETGTSCNSPADCCSGSCTSNVCASGAGACIPVGDACANSAQCCTGACVSGKCGAKTCTAHGDACTAPADCCSGACENGTCVDKPTCAWTGSCAGDFQCCTGTCTSGKCAPPIGDSQCNFLEKAPGGDFASCFDCVSTSCCAQEWSASIDWVACFQDCMSSLDTFDAFGACTASCAAVGAPTSDFGTCVGGACSTVCK
ncbi:MAG TPA: hypothetical protein VGH28_29080 [Polyangiaceae bacterium]